MPFTLAHPAAVFFFKNKKFNLTALILGSMAPDFIYFLNFRPYGNLGHKILGFFILNLPLCILLAYIFHNFIISSHNNSFLTSNQLFTRIIPLFLSSS